MQTVEQPATPRNSWGQPADTPSAKKAVVRLPLETTRDAQRALARLIRRTLQGEIETADLSRYANALMILVRIIEGGDLAAMSARLDDLEKRGFH